MKANEAPEKIYLSSSSFKISDYVTKTLTTKRSGDLEYVKKDVFVEKTVNWLINNTDITPTGIKNYRKAMKED